MSHPIGNGSRDTHAALNTSIVTYHTPADELKACLDSLTASAAVSRIYVVDNASEERIRDICGGYGPSVTYIPNRNTGYGSGHNIALRHTLGGPEKYHLVINSDVKLSPGTLEACVAYMDAHPEAVELIPRVSFPDGSFQPVCHPLPSPVDMFRNRFLPRRIISRWSDHYHLRSYDMTEPVNVPYHYGCFMLLRADALRKAGLFDERYFMYAEDLDLSRRMHAVGETIYFPSETIVHMRKAESHRSPRMFIRHAASLVKYFCKWGWGKDPERQRVNRDLWQRLAPMARKGASTAKKNA